MNMKKKPWIVWLYCISKITVLFVSTFKSEIQPMNLVVVKLHSWLHSWTSNQQLTELSHPATLELWTSWSHGLLLIETMWYDKKLLGQLPESLWGEIMLSAHIDSCHLLKQIQSVCLAWNNIRILSWIMMKSLYCLLYSTGKSHYNQCLAIWEIITGCAVSIYPEVEQPAVVLIKCLVKRNNLPKDVRLECQGSNRCKKPAITWVEDRWPLSCQKTLRWNQ